MTSPYPDSRKNTLWESNVTTGKVFDVQRYAVHDGPGIRTLIFLMGCPLRCLWCQNPEGWTMQPVLLHYSSRCTGCGECAPACPNGAVDVGETGDVRTDHSRCTGCGQCVSACPEGARAVAGKEITVAMTMHEIRKDMPFYTRSGGGVTLSGGEPCMQPDFAADVLSSCKGEFIHTAVETSGYADTQSLLKVLQHADRVLYDIKHMDTREHERLTGVGNETILKNARYISNTDVEIVIRIPLIPGYNDSPSNMEATARFVKSLDSVIRVDVLPYHSMARSKYDALGIEYPLSGVLPPDKETVNHTVSIIRSQGLNVSVEGLVG